MENPLPRRRIFHLYSRRENGGIIAVEVALLLPFVLAIFFGIIEFGSVMYVRHVMFFSAREAARSYVTGASPSTSSAVTVAETLLADAEAPGTFTVSAEALNLGTSTASIKISITTPMADAAVIDVIPDVVLAGRILTATATMFVEESASANTECGKKKGSCSAKKKTTKTKTKKKKKK